MESGFIVSKKTIAVVIPAWKTDFLHRTLEGFANQTNRDFRVYVGDDSSPGPVSEIVDSFSGRLDIVYHRFGSNLGGTDLVAQWERCIALSSDEPWIWLFSDDDMADPTCAADLIEAIGQNPSSDLFRFDLRVVDEFDAVQTEYPRFPGVYPTLAFYRDRRDGKLTSFATEFVFSRRVYQDNGFVKFDLAWGSDVCTWTRFAGINGISTIGPGKVSWRSSSRNITPNNTNLALLERKIRAEATQISWASDWFRGQGYQWGILDEIRQIDMASRGGLKDWPWRKPLRYLRLIRFVAKHSTIPFALPANLVLVVGTRIRCIYWKLSHRWNRR
jgi:hypothetical protein